MQGIGDLSKCSGIPSISTLGADCYTTIANTIRMLGVEVWIVHALANYRSGERAGAGGYSPDMNGPVARPTGKGNFLIQKISKRSVQSPHATGSFM